LCGALGVFVGLYWEQVSVVGDSYGEDFQDFQDRTEDVANSLQALGLIPNGILAVWPDSLALKKFAFLTVNVHLVTAVL
jgi:hypothetical protein